MDQLVDLELEDYLSLPSLAERLKTKNAGHRLHKVPSLECAKNDLKQSKTEKVDKDGSGPLQETVPFAGWSTLTSKTSTSSGDCGYDILGQISSCEEEEEEKISDRKHGKSPRKQKLSAEEKEKLKQEKMQAKAKKVMDKARDKALKSSEKAIKKAIRPGENLKYITVLVDPDIVTLWKDGETLVRGLNESQVQFLLQKNVISNSVVWEKKAVERIISQDGKVTENTTTFEEGYVLLIVKFPEFLDKVFGSSGSVQSYATELRNLFHTKKVTIFITGMTSYYKSKKNGANRDFRNGVRDESAPSQSKRKKKDSPPFFPREDVEECLLELEIIHSVSHYHVDSAKDFTNFVVSFTKAIADKDYKLNERQTSFTFCSSEFNVDTQSVKVDGAGNGLSRLWVNQIRQLPNVGLETAQAIAAVYPLPACLKKAYEKCRSESEAKLLLEDIVVRRGAGVLTSTRRVGAELSKKLYSLFTSTDGNISL